MSQAKVLMTVRGEFLKKTLIAPGIELALFRNDEEDFDVFEIKILLLQSRIFTLNQHYCDEKTALREYEEILKTTKEVFKNLNEILEINTKGAAILCLSKNNEGGCEKFEIQFTELPNWPLRILFKHQNLDLVRMKYYEILKNLGDGSFKAIQRFKGKCFI